MRLSQLFEMTRPPAEVYHGTPNVAFDRFNTNRGGMGGQLGYWFASTQDAAKQFAHKRLAGRKAGIKVCRLRIEQPKEFGSYQEYLDAVAEKRGRGEIEDGVRSLRRSLIRQGYDGVVIRNSDTDNGGVRDDWVAFYPHQIEVLRTITNEAAQPFTSAMDQLRAAADPGDMREPLKSLGAFLGDHRPIEQKYQVGDTLKHIRTGQIVDVVSASEAPRPILTVRVRTTGREGVFYADEFDPAPVEHWRRTDEAAGGGNWVTMYRGLSAARSLEKPAWKWGVFFSPSRLTAHGYAGSGGVVREVQIDVSGALRWTPAITGEFKGFVNYARQRDLHTAEAQAHLRRYNRFVDDDGSLDDAVRYLMREHDNRVSHHELDPLMGYVKAFAAERGADVILRTHVDGGGEVPFAEAVVFSGTRVRFRDTVEERVEHPAADAMARWFAGSKIVDQQGRPLRLYHGTSKDQDFKSFKVPGNGAWFATDAAEASSYAENNDSQTSEWDGWQQRFVPKHTAARIIPVFVRAVNPKHYDVLPNDIRNAVNYRRAQRILFDRLRSEGHDAVTIGHPEIKVVVVLGNANQIKSAIGNRNFNPAKKGLTERDT